MHKDASKIVRRYALALAECQTNDEERRETLRAAESMLKLLTPDVERYFAKSGTHSEKLRETVRFVADSVHAPKPFARVLDLMWENGRLPVVRPFLLQVVRMLDSALGIVRVKYVSAMPLRDAELNEVEKSFQGESASDIRVSAHVDESLLAGCVIAIGYNVIDMSLKTRLDEINESLSQGV